MAFSAVDRVSITLMTQDKGFGAKKFIMEFSSKLRTMSALNKLLLYLTSQKLL